MKTFFNLVKFRNRPSDHARQSQNRQFAATPKLHSLHKHWNMRMKKTLLSIAMCLLLSAWASAETSVWKAQKGNSILFIGGTCHVLRESDFPLPPEFEKAYMASEIVVFETDMAKLQDSASRKKLLSKAMYADGSTIDKHLSPQVYGELNAYCESNGIPLKALKQFKPSMIMVTLTVMELMKLGVTQQGVDQYFHNLATRDKKAEGGLETAEEQIDYLTSMADGNEDEFVTYSIRDMNNLRENYEILANAWRKGDTGTLNELMVTELKTKQPKLFRKLITNRNKNWLPLIDAYQKTPRTEFILVGVGHLVGADGIIEELKKRGYRVEKL